MEKNISKSNNSLFSGIVAIVIGIILVIWPHNILQWALRLIGIVSIVIGVVQFLGFLVRTRGVENRWKYLPLSAPIAAVWGILLLLSPDLWTSLFMILFGILLIFLGLTQLISMVKVRKGGIAVNWLYFVFPILLIIAGFVTFAQPIYTATWFMIFIGGWILAYGIVEVFSYFSLRGPIHQLQESEKQDGKKIEQ
ncbi:HdeD family acid-resistance protein [Millionella massiliensis]|uniref:HdeD family acid-resistance protein n=1 Tax=Millionella massiliensis TaxID=1871023 RepID=UPI0008D96119|nr:DUF308 domain-containing protein [Millionella massiliensis]